MGITKNEVRFNDIVGRYRKAFEDCNKKRLHSVFYKSGFVYVQSDAGCSPNRYRLSSFEKMLDTLEFRVSCMSKISNPLP